MTLRVMVLSLLMFAVSGCAQSFLKGATLTNKKLEAESSADFVVNNCREYGSNAPVDGPKNVTYHLVTYEGAPGLFENLKGNSSVITNSWVEADGRHFFVYVLASGWEFIVPESGNGKRLVRQGGTVRAEDGTARPTNKPPNYECDLVRTRG